MLDAIIGTTVGKITGYLIGEALKLKGVKVGLEELRAELLCIQGYEKDEAREKEDEVSKEWIKLVVDIAYDVDDVLETFSMRTNTRTQRRGPLRLFNKIGEKKDAYYMASDISTLKRRILDITRKRGTYGIGSIVEPRGENITSLRVKQLRRARPDDQEEIVVGLEDDAKILLEKLLDDDVTKNRYIISTFGMGGLGKTALARKLYNSKDLNGRFNCRGWTYVSKDYEPRDILIRIIRSLGVSSVVELERIKLLDGEELEAYLHDLLKDKRYLLVVDDVWDIEAWDSLKRALPRNRRSRVIITTRNKVVAESIDMNVYAHMLRFLTFEESCKLFEQKAFKNMQVIDADIKKIGEEMIQKCEGLPLAIVVLGGLMSRKRPNEWRDVRAGFWRRLKDNSIHFSTVFDLSFKDLRHELKLCFLYLSVFPEDYEINVENLIHLLVAEGSIQEDKKRMTEDVAQDYIEELIGRSLVEGVRIERGRVFSCRIHDLLRDEALKKAEELNFVHVYNEQHFSITCRREVVHHILKNNYLCDRRVNEGMRSFLFFGERKGITQYYVGTITLKLKLLRVLNIGGLEFDSKTYISLSLPRVIGGLKHLRYLGIADTGLQYLPTSVISKLQFLQTLEASRNYFHEMTDLRKLTLLRHVLGEFNGGLLLGDTINLRTLRRITTDTWSTLKHDILLNLRHLEISNKFSKESSVPFDLSSLSNLKNLRVLKLEVHAFKSSSNSIKAVQFMDVVFPSLESLVLIGTSIDADLMLGLQQQPSLEDLILLNCDYLGERLCISAQGFARLRKLELFLVRLNVLQIEEEAMPSLMVFNMPIERTQLDMLIPDRLLALVQYTGKNDVNWPKSLLFLNL